MWVASGQADHARRRRAEWEERDGEPPESPIDETTDAPAVPALTVQDS
jgi:hypothetical protein